MPNLPLTGRCQCDSAVYSITAEPKAVYVCHCRECQKQSASAFGISASVPKIHFLLERGEVRTWSRRTDSGRVLNCQFCPVCGTRLWHEGPGWDVLSVKGGTLDQPLDLRRAIHIWTARRLSGVVVPDDARQFPGEPE